MKREEETVAHYLVYSRVFWDEVGSGDYDQLQDFLETEVRHDWYTDLQVREEDHVLWQADWTGAPTRRPSAVIGSRCEDLGNLCRHTAASVNVT